MNKTPESLFMVLIQGVFLRIRTCLADDGGELLVVLPNQLSMTRLELEVVEIQTDIHNGMNV